MTQNEFKELQDICKKYTTEEIVVLAMPKKITNSGKQKEVVEFAIVHKATKKDVRFIYRDDFSNMRNTVKKAIDELINRIHQEVVKPKEKPKNSL
jgi:RNase H-fold protein (predicted Holliday junction resolvase)